MKKNIILTVVIVLSLGLFFLGYQYFLADKLTGSKEKTTDQSLSRIKEKGKLVVGSDIPYGIMEFFEESGKPVGLEVDIANEIASRLEVELEFRDYDWEPLFSAIKTGEVDLAISAITITEERMSEMLFSVPYFNGGQSIIVKKNREDIKLPEDLLDKKLGIQKDTTGQDEAKKYTKNELIEEYLSYNSDDAKRGMIYDLEIGKIDAIILDYVAAMDVVKNHPNTKIIGEPFTQEFYGVATKIGNESLIQEIDDALREMKRTRKLDQLREKWLK